MARFYGHFAAAYGTIWILLLLAAMVTGSHINAGEFGLYGFPILSAIYAMIRVSGHGARSRETEDLRARVADLEARLP
jgi:hypothetical protein